MCPCKDKWPSQETWRVVNSFAVVLMITQVICTHRLDGSPSRTQEQRKGKGEKWSMGKGGMRGVHPSPSHTELGGEKEKKAIVADKRAIQLRTPRT